jgi:hypothetical protein
MQCTSSESYERMGCDSTMEKAVIRAAIKLIICTVGIPDLRTMGTLVAPFMLNTRVAFSMELVDAIAGCSGPLVEFKPMNRNDLHTKYTELMRFMKSVTAKIMPAPCMHPYNEPSYANEAEDVFIRRSGSIVKKIFGVVVSLIIGTGGLVLKNATESAAQVQVANPIFSPNSILHWDDNEKSMTSVLTVHILHHACAIN